MILSATLIVGCATSDQHKLVSKIKPDPLTGDPYFDLSIGGVPTITSDANASLGLTSGEYKIIFETTKGDHKDGPKTLLLPVTMRQNRTTVVFPEKHRSGGSFGLHDQCSFLTLLQTELSRLKVFKNVTVVGSSLAIAYDIEIDFTRTVWNSKHQYYILFVTMNITGGKDSFSKTYRVHSNSKATKTEQLFTNARMAKAKAVLNLLEAVIPDIQAYVAANSTLKDDKATGLDSNN